MRNRNLHILVLSVMRQVSNSSLLSWQAFIGSWLATIMEYAIFNVSEQERRNESQA